jgi:hypothetical protein
MTMALLISVQPRTGTIRRSKRLINPSFANRMRPVCRPRRVDRDADRIATVGADARARQPTVVESGRRRRQARACDACVDALAGVPAVVSRRASAIIL